MKRNPEYSPTRYVGRPLLAILDQFVLSVALETPAETESTLNQVTCRIWKGTGNWKDLVIKNLELPPSILDSLKTMWNNNQKISQDTGVKLSPWQFAIMVVDTNFAPMIDKL